MDKPGLEEWGPEGSWPSWWRGVASVYAANLAAHVVFPDFDKSYMCAARTFDMAWTILEICSIHASVTLHGPCCLEAVCCHGA